MLDPDVTADACICRPTDNIMAMGHAHYCVGAARRTAQGARLPATVEQILLDIAPDEENRVYRRRRLGFDDVPAMRDTFLQALQSPGIHVWRDQCEDEPGEVVVRARGDSVDGSYWCDLSIIMLDPWWSTKSELAEQLADDIVEHWDRLQAALRPAT